MKVVKYIPFLFFVFFSCKNDVNLSFKNISIGCPSDSIEYFISQDESSSIGAFDTVSLIEYPSFMLRSDYHENRKEYFLDCLEEKEVYIFKTKLITLDDKVIPAKCCLEIQDRRVFRIIVDLYLQNSGRSDFLSIENLYHNKYGKFDFWHSNGKKQNHDMITNSRTGHNEGGYVWEWNNQRLYLRETYTKKSSFLEKEYKDIKYSIIYEDILLEKKDVQNVKKVQKQKEQIKEDEETNEKSNNKRLRLKQDI